MSYEEKTIEYSPEWKGPLKDRSCTDWPCLAIFVVFMACWAGVGFYAISYGNIDTLLAPVDSEGRKCGIDEDVVDTPFLVFFDLRQCFNTDGKCHTPQVCRKKCPDTNWYYDFLWDLQSVENLRESMICKRGIELNTKNRTELKKLIEDKKVCAEWYLESTPIVGRCIPQKIPNNKTFLGLITESEFKDAQKIMKALAWGEAVLDAAIESRGLVLGLIVGGAAICLIYVFLLRWLAFPFVFLSAAVLCGFFSYISYYFYGRYDRSEKETKWIVLTIIFGIVAALILLIILCLLKRIRLACQLIKEASKAVMTTYSSLFFPILPWLLHLATIVYFVVTGLYLSTINTPESWQFGFLITVHLVGFIWFYCFISALGEMILASAFATWYWTYDKFNVPFFTVLTGAWRTIRYHLGTVAFGSLLITICRLVRVLLEAVRHAAREEGGFFYRYCGQYFISCAQCLMGYLEKFLKFMNRNAYIVCAVYGKGLCSSASDALSLIIRNALRVIVLNNIVSWLLFLGKLLITVSMGVLTWWLYTDTKYEMEFWWVPVVFVCVGAYLVASVFFTVYTVAVDTIFLCFLEDCERHDGSSARPYYMSRQLRKLLHKDL